MKRALQWFDLRGFLLGLIIVVLSMAAYLGVQKWPAIKTELLAKRIVGCAEKQSLACARPLVQKLLDERGGVGTMNVLAGHLAPMSCHYIGHVVGQELYNRVGDVEGAIRQCSRTCDSACVHGTVGGAFAEALGLDGFEEFDIDLKHLDPDELRTIGERLCRDIGTCHGVGHSLFQIYQEFDPAFSLCREVAGDNVRMCYNGVVMEYADALSSRSMGQLLNVTLPEEETLDTFCDYPTLTETYSCYRYMPRIVASTLSAKGLSEAEALEHMKQICEAHELDEQRIACYAGLGSYGSYLVIRDLDAAVSSCESLGREQAVASCIMGRVGVATLDRRKRLAQYCASQSEAYTSICYQSLLFFLNRVGAPIESQAELCENSNDACNRALERNTIDPAQDVRTYAR